MNDLPDVTATIVLQREGILAIPALASLRDGVDAARASGLQVEATAMLAQADEQTRDIARTKGAWLCDIHETPTGDLGLARNAVTACARGTFLAVFDGDGLWGAQWIQLAHAAATAGPVEAIWHPAAVYHFKEADFDRHSTHQVPDPLARSAFSIQGSSDSKNFQPESLLLNDLWSGDVFARRSIYQRFPYRAAAEGSGFGAEAWRWNIATTWLGVVHQVVSDTVHLIRLKDASESLLPHLPDAIRPRFGRAPT